MGGGLDNVGFSSFWGGMGGCGAAVWSELRFEYSLIGAEDEQMFDDQAERAL